MDIAIPAEFGGSWKGFVREWCLGASLASDPIVVAQALTTLTRLWPEEAARVVREPSRGIAIAAGMVEGGLLLDACEAVEGFEGVLHRMRGGERSAYSELMLAAALRHLGYEPRLAAPVDGHVLDAACDVDGTSAYFEMVVPERSDASANDARLVNELIAQVRHRVSKCRVELEICPPLDLAGINAILAIVESAAPSTWMQVHSLARIRRIDAGSPLLPVFDGRGEQVTFFEDRIIQGESTNVITHWKSPDVRAKRVFNKKYQQLSKRAANILVVNVSSSDPGMKRWPLEMAHLLKPTQNRRVGAIAFFWEAVPADFSASVRRRWRVVVNPHAHLLVPERLLSDLESLDESRYFGAARLERIIVT